MRPGVRCALFVATGLSFEDRIASNSLGGLSLCRQFDFAVQLYDEWMMVLVLKNVA